MHVQESTKYTPFELVFGGMARLPVDFNRLADYNVEEVLELHAKAMDPDQEEVDAKRKETEEKVFASTHAVHGFRQNILLHKFRCCSIFCSGGRHKAIKWIQHNQSSRVQGPNTRPKEQPKTH